MKLVYRFFPVCVVILALAACSNELTPRPATSADQLPTEFPNEEGVLISPEGQAIIDAVRDGRIDAPDLVPEPLEIMPDAPLSLQGTVPSAVRHPWASSMSHFLYHRRIRSPSYANWTTDICSNSPDKTPFYNFVNPCIRHDYGYRNWKKYRAFTSSAKLSIDRKFLGDMKAHCATRSWVIRGECYRYAYIYYSAVRALG